MRWAIIRMAFWPIMMSRQMWLTLVSIRKPIRAPALNGFCFRGAEKIYEIMQQQGLGDKKVWATEFGWITRPPDRLLERSVRGAAASGKSSRTRSRPTNLVGAYQYADAHWPWMGGMFVFNLDFNQNPWSAGLRADALLQHRRQAGQERPGGAAQEQGQPDRPVADQRQSADDLDRRRRAARSRGRPRSISTMQAGSRWSTPPPSMAAPAWCPA